MDTADFVVVAKRKWQAVPFNDGSIWYARSGKWDSVTKRVRLVTMHRFLLGGVSTGVDHINLDGLDNRRVNLRPATRSQNKANGARYKSNTSGLVGVSQRSSGRWRAYVNCGGRRYWAGAFESAGAAAQARDELAKRLHGEFARGASR